MLKKEPGPLFFWSWVSTRRLNKQAPKWDRAFNDIIMSVLTIGNSFSRKYYIIYSNWT